MDKMYTQRTAALRATKFDSNIINAKKLLIYSGGAIEFANDGEVKLTKEALYIPSIVFESGTLSSSSEGKVTWNGEELGGSTFDASNNITFTGLDTFTQYVTFNGGMICNSDIVLNGARLLLANGAAVEVYQGTDIPLPEGGGTGSTTPGTGNSGESIDTSIFAKLNEDNTFAGNNNFTGSLTLNGKNILTTEDISSLPGKHNVGEQWISMDGTIPLGGVPFNGQLLNIADYQDLYNWAKNNGRVITETEWQTLNSNNSSNVSYYSDYSSTQFRMPNFNGYLKANLGAGNYIKEGLPNITGVSYSLASVYSLAANTGAFSETYVTGTSRTQPLDGTAGDLYLNFNAANCNRIYGNSTHVTPETNTILIGVYAFNTIVNGSAFDAGEELTTNINVSIAKPFIDIGYPYADSSGSLLALRSVNYSDNPGAFELFAKNATSQKILSGTPDGKLTWDGKDVVTIIESWSSDSNWYRKYSNGWIEQGGMKTALGSGGWTTVNLHTAFSNTKYNISLTGAGTAITTGITHYNIKVKADAITTTNFKISDGSNDENYIYWYACGY